MATAAYVYNQPVVVFYRGQWVKGRVSGVKEGNRYCIIALDTPLFDASGLDMYAVSRAHQDDRPAVRAAARMKDPPSLKSRKPAKQPLNKRSA